MRPRWLSTVRTEIDRRSAMSRLASPCGRERRDVMFAAAQLRRRPARARRGRQGRLAASPPALAHGRRVRPPRRRRRAPRSARLPAAAASAARSSAPSASKSVADAVSRVASPATRAAACSAWARTIALSVAAARAASRGATAAAAPSADGVVQGPGARRARGRTARHHRQRSAGCRARRRRRRSTATPHARPRRRSVANSPKPGPSRSMSSAAAVLASASPSSANASALIAAVIGRRPPKPVTVDRRGEPLDPLESRPRSPLRQGAACEMNAEPGRRQRLAGSPCMVEPGAAASLRRSSRWPACTSANSSLTRWLVGTGTPVRSSSSRCCVARPPAHLQRLAGASRHRQGGGSRDRGDDVGARRVDVHSLEEGERLERATDSP